MTRKGFLSRLLAPLLLPLLGWEDEAMVSDLVSDHDLKKGWVMPASEAHKYKNAVNSIVDEWKNGIPDLYAYEYYTRTGEKYMIDPDVVIRTEVVRYYHEKTKEDITEIYYHTKRSSFLLDRMMKDGYFSCERVELINPYCGEMPTKKGYYFRGHYVYEGFINPSVIS